MKKSIAVFLILCMVMPFMLVYGETAETDIAAEPIVVSENVKLLAALGLFDEKNENLIAIYFLKNFQG